jgi:acyl carrier protein
MAIEEHGSEVLVAEADAGDGEQMRRVLDLARERFGTLHGVIHGAGHTAADALCLVAQADRAHCGRHFRPKIGGALVLHDLLRNEELDFVLLLSSLSAMLGGLGFVAYAAANVFLDAFAIRRNRDGGTRWISVEWDGWYFAADGQAEAERDAAAANLILPDEGAEALSRIIYRGPDVPVAVSPVDLQARLDQWIRLAPLREISEAPAETPRSLHERPALPSAFVAPRSEVETTVAGIWQQLLGIDHVGVHDNFFELGGHSLLALQLIARLADAYRVELSVQQVFEAATVAEQADAVERGRAPQGDDEEAKIAAMLDFVEQLSDSDVSELLRRHDASRDLR